MTNDIHGEAAPIKPIPTYAYSQDRANAAYAVYAAMRRMEVEQPTLAENRLWIVHRNEAYAMFCKSFEKIA